MYQLLNGVKTSAEAMDKAGLTWKVGLSEISTRGKVIPNRFAIVRETDERVYGIVTGDYHPVQHPDAMAFFDAAVESGQATYEVVGVVNDGGKVWIEARLPDSIGIMGEEIHKYILLVNSHDGASALQVYYTTIRVVCQNRLAMARRRASFSFYARHTERVEEKMAAAKDVLGLAGNYFQEWTDEANQLASESINPTQFDGMILSAFRRNNMEEETDTEKKARSNISNLLITGRGMNNPVIQGTKWAAYNALAEYIDHTKPTRSNEENHIKNILFGAGAKIKEKAWSYLLSH